MFISRARHSALSRAISLAVVFLFLVNDLAFGVSPASIESDRSALAPPSALKPAGGIFYDKKTKKCYFEVYHDNIREHEEELYKIESRELEIIEEYLNEHPGKTRQDAIREALKDRIPGHAFRNRWLSGEIMSLMGQMLVITRDYGLENPKSLLIPLLKEYMQKRDGMAEVRLEGYDIDGIEEVRDGKEIKSFSLPIRRDGIPAFKYIYNFEGGEIEMPQNDRTKVYTRIEAEDQDRLVHIAASLASFGHGTTEVTEVANALQQVFSGINLTETMVSENAELSAYLETIKDIRETIENLVSVIGLIYREAKSAVINKNLRSSALLSWQNDTEESYRSFKEAKRKFDSIKESLIESCPKNKKSMLSLFDSYLKKADERLEDRLLFAKGEIQNTPVDLNDIFAHFFENLSVIRKVPQSKEYFELKLPAEPVRIKGNKNSIISLICNLADNCLKYAVEFKKDDAKVTIDTRVVNGEVVITISDNGPGMSPKKLADIWKPFHTTGGTGIGLTEARLIVKDHGGTIEVASELGKGTTFTLRLPTANEPGSGQAIRLPLAPKTDAADPAPQVSAAQDVAGQVRLSTAEEEVTLRKTAGEGQEMSRIESQALERIRLFDIAFKMRNICHSTGNILQAVVASFDMYLSDLGVESESIEYDDLFERFKMLHLMKNLENLHNRALALMPQDTAESLIQGLEALINDSQRVYDELGIIANDSNIKRARTSLSRFIKTIHKDLGYLNKPLEIKPIDINKLIRKELETTKAADSGKRIVCVENLSDDVRITNFVTYYENLLTYLFRNLLQNAKFHGLSNGSMEGAKIEVCSTVLGGEIVTKVSDNGKGMPEEALKIVDEKTGKRRVFTPEYSSRKSENEPFHGLGLALCWDIVRLLGGRIDVESELGKGTTFTIRLPLASKTPAAGPASQAGAAAGKSHISTDEIHKDPRLERYERIVTAIRSGYHGNYAFTAHWCRGFGVELKKYILGADLSDAQKIVLQTIYKDIIKLTDFNVNLTREVKGSKFETTPDATVEKWEMGFVEQHNLIHHISSSMESFFEENKMLTNNEDRRWAMHFKDLVLKYFDSFNNHYVQQKQEPSHIVDLSTLKCFKDWNTIEHLTIITMKIPTHSFVRADELLLNILFDNIMGNAFRYSNKARGKDGSKIDVRAEATKGILSVTISDNGDGIPADKIADIFNLSYSTTGGGVGLAGAYWIVKDLGGTIEVDSLTQEDMDKSGMALVCQGYLPKLLEEAQRSESVRAYAGEAYAKLLECSRPYEKLFKSMAEGNITNKKISEFSDALNIIMNDMKTFFASDETKPGYEQVRAFMIDGLSQNFTYVHILRSRLKSGHILDKSDKDSIRKSFLQYQGRLEIWRRIAEGKRAVVGTTFTLRLPVVSAESSGRALRLPPAVSGPSSGQAIRLPIADQPSAISHQLSAEDASLSDLTPKGAGAIAAGESQQADMTTVAKWYGEMWEYARSAYGPTQFVYQFFDEARDPGKWKLHPKLGSSLGVDETVYAIMLSKMTVGELIDEYQKLEPDKFVHQDKGQTLDQVEQICFCGHLLGRTMAKITSYDNALEDRPEALIKHPDRKVSAICARKKLLLYREWAYRHWDKTPKMRSCLLFSFAGNSGPKDDRQTLATPDSERIPAAGPARESGAVAADSGMAQDRKVAKSWKDGFEEMNRLISGKLRQSEKDGAARPLLVFICGRPVTGKTTLKVLIDKWRFGLRRKEIKVFQNDSQMASTYSDEMDKKQFPDLKLVIIEGYRIIPKLADKYKPDLVIELTASEDVMIERSGEGYRELLSKFPRRAYDKIDLVIDTGDFDFSNSSLAKKLFGSLNEYGLPIPGSTSSTVPETATASPTSRTSAGAGLNETGDNERQMTRERSERIAIAVRSFDHGPATDPGTPLQVMLLDTNYLGFLFEPSSVDLVKKGARSSSIIREVGDEMRKFIDEVRNITRERGASRQEVDMWTERLNAFKYVSMWFKQDFEVLKDLYEESKEKFGEKEKKEIENAMNIIDKQSKKLLTILESRIDFFQGKHGNDTIAVADLLRDASKRHPLNEKEEPGLSISFKGVPKEGLYISGNRITLLNAFANIFVNSRDAAEKNKQEEYIEVSAERIGNDVVISIKDHSGGIRPDLLEMGSNGRLKLFDLNITTKEHGTGLGTTETWYAVKDMGGTIDVKSEPGKGTTFTIRLPLAPKTDAAGPASRAGAVTPQTKPQHGLTEAELLVGGGEEEILSGALKKEVLTELSGSAHQWRGFSELRKDIENCNPRNTEELGGKLARHTFDRPYMAKLCAKMAFLLKGFGVWESFNNAMRAGGATVTLNEELSLIYVRLPLSGPEWLSLEMRNYLRQDRGYSDLFLTAGTERPLSEEESYRCALTSLVFTHYLNNPLSGFPADWVKLTYRGGEIKWGDLGNISPQAAKALEIVKKLFALHDEIYVNHFPVDMRGMMQNPEATFTKALDYARRVVSLYEEFGSIVNRPEFETETEGLTLWNDPENKLSDNLRIRYNLFKNMPDALPGCTGFEEYIRFMEWGKNATPSAERIHAIDFHDAVKVIQAKRKKKAEKKETKEKSPPDIIAVGKSWIKGYEEGRHLQYDALNPLITFITNYCGKRNIPFIIADDDKLPGLIAREKELRGLPADAKVVMLAGANKDGITSEAIKELMLDRSYIQDETYTIVGVNGEELTVDSYIRIMEILTIALRLSIGIKPNPKNDHMAILPPEGRRLFYIIVPHAERMMNYEERRAIYEIQKFA
jgi:signal transduction histidine kinase